MNKYQKKPIPNSSLLININESHIQNDEERVFIQNYKQIYQQLEEAEAKLFAINNEISKLTPSKGSNYTEKLKVLKEEKYKANIEFNRYEHKLNNLKEKEIYKSLVDREIYKLRAQRETLGELAFASLRENDNTKSQSADSFQNLREENLSKPKTNEKNKSVIKALNRLHDEGVFTALTYVITFLWFGYLVHVVATADAHIIGKIFFIIWSLVLAFLFVIHKCGGSGDD